MHAPSTSEREPLRGARVLVVEDDPDCREMLADFLAMDGASVCVAGTGNAGYDAFVRNRPNVIVSDIWMPDGDGFWMIARIRALPPVEGGLTPAIAVSAGENARKALMAGYHLFLPKPLDPDTLVASIADFLSEDPGATARAAPWTISEHEGLVVMTFVGHVRANDMRRMTDALVPHLERQPCRIIADFRRLVGFAPSVPSVAERAVWDFRHNIRDVRMVGGTFIMRLVSAAACRVLGVPCSVIDDAEAETSRAT